MCPRSLRRGQQFTSDATVQHRRLVHDDDSLCVPLSAAVLQPEQLGMHRAGFGEPVCLEVLRDGVGRRQADDAPPVQRVRVTDRREDKTLAGTGATLDECQVAGTDRVLERRLLIGPKRATGQSGTCHPGRHGGRARPCQLCRIGQSGTFLLAHRLRGEPLRRIRQSRGHTAR